MVDAIILFSPRRSEFFFSSHYFFFYFFEVNFLFLDCFLHFKMYDEIKNMVYGHKISNLPSHTHGTVWKMEHMCL